MCEALALSEGEINIKTARSSAQHNCGISENPGTIDCRQQLSSDELDLQ